MSIKLDDMKFEESHVDQKFSNSSRLRSLRNTLRNVEYQRHFEVGQILVKRHLKETGYGNNRSQPGSLEKNNNGIVQKYIVANKLHDGLILCRMMNASGRPGKGIHIIADEWHDDVRFEEDPDIADSILLDYDYDPLELPKLMGKAKSKQQRTNRPIRVENFIKDKRGNDSLNTVISYLKENCIGDSIWKIDDDKVEKFAIQNVVGNDYNAEAHIIKENGDSYKIKVFDITNSYSWGGKWYLKEPMTLEKALEHVKLKAR